MKNNAVTDQEKREKKIVVKKLAEMEEELKLLALSENLTDQVGFLCRKFLNFRLLEMNKLVGFYFYF